MFRRIFVVLVLFVVLVVVVVVLVLVDVVVLGWFYYGRVFGDSFQGFF